MIVNSDEFLIRKKGMVGTPLADRLELVRAVRYVDEVVVCVDRDQTVAETLRMLRPEIFAKGGDRTPGHMPESELRICLELGIKIVYGVDGKVRRSTGWEWHGLPRELERIG